VVVSGWQFVGKSYYLDVLAQLPEMADARIVRMDAILRDLYGDRPDTDITKTEHLYKNEATRSAMLRELVLGAETLLTETVLMTERDHQVPMLDMIKRAEEYVQAIERELAERTHTLVPIPTKVNLRVILLHCSLDCTNRRIERARGQERAYSPISTLLGMESTITQFEYPGVYTPLIIDTSDESPGAEHARLGEMRGFITDGWLPHDNDARWPLLRAHREEIRAIIDFTRSSS
jgi:hypothetical protein